MKCLSLHQPWATLIAIGAKRIETRGWSTSYRGPLAIHAAKFYSMQTAAFANSEPCVSALREHGLSWEKLPRGAIIAVARIEDCISTSRLERIENNRSPALDSQIASTLRFAGHAQETINEALNAWSLTDQERAFGDFSVGRFGWLLDDIHRCPAPITYIGRQGIFNITEPDVLEQLTHAI